MPKVSDAHREERRRQILDGARRAFAAPRLRGRDRRRSRGGDRPLARRDLQLLPEQVGALLRARARRTSATSARSGSSRGSRASCAGSAARIPSGPASTSRSPACCAPTRSAASNGRRGTPTCRHSSSEQLLAAPGGRARARRPRRSRRSGSFIGVVLDGLAVAPRRRLSGRRRGDTRARPVCAGAEVASVPREDHPLRRRRAPPAPGDPPGQGARPPRGRGRPQLRGAGPRRGGHREGRRLRRRGRGDQGDGADQARRRDDGQRRPRRAGRGGGRRGARAAGDRRRDGAPDDAQDRDAHAARRRRRAAAALCRGPVDRRDAPRRRTRSGSRPCSSRPTRAASAPSSGSSRSTRSTRICTRCSSRPRPARRSSRSSSTGIEMNGIVIARDGASIPLTLSDRLRPPGVGFGVGWIHVYPGDGVRRAARGVGARRRAHRARARPRRRASRSRS